MKYFADGDGNFPLEEKSASVAGSPPTADNFNGVTTELVNLLLATGIPLDPMSGAGTGSDGLPMLESESNKQLFRAIQNLDEKTYLRGAADNDRLISNVIGKGIVQGLDATKTDTLIVSISKGFGYDVLGQQVLLTEPMVVDLNSEATATEITIPLALRYAIVPANYIIGDKNPNYKDTISIMSVYGDDVISTDLLIANITIDNTGITKITAPINLLDQRKKDIVDLIYYINYQYQQLPDKTTGLFREEDSPKHNIGGDWELEDTKIFNNVPIVEPNKFGVMKLFPDRSAIFTSVLTGFINDTIGEFPVPFISLPFCSPFNGESGINWSAIYSQREGNNVFGVTTKPETTSANFKYFEISTITGNVVFTATGYWKSPTDPISADEEKWYVKIWKRIG